MKTGGVRKIPVILLLLFVSISAQSLAAEIHEVTALPIEIHFKYEASSGREYIQAETTFNTGKPAVYVVFTSITEYASLHPWIRKIKLVRENCSNQKVYRIDFDFPWPVGHKWSIVVVDFLADGSIAWRQTDGSLDENLGSIKLQSQGRGVQLKYAAIIDVGLPNALTRHHKKKFVRQFLSAASRLATGTEFMRQEASYASGLNQGSTVSLFDED